MPDFLQTSYTPGKGNRAQPGEGLRSKPLVHLQLVDPQYPNSGFVISRSSVRVRQLASSFSTSYGGKFQWFRGLDGITDAILALRKRTLLDDIHLNPVRAGLVPSKTYEGLLDDPWSSLAKGYAGFPEQRSGEGSRDPRRRIDHHGGGPALRDGGRATIGIRGPAPRRRAPCRGCLGPVAEDFAKAILDRRAALDAERRKRFGASAEICSQAREGTSQRNPPMEDTSFMNERQKF
jgi:hypothetical protein